MRMWKHPLFWMTTDAIAVLFIINVDKFLEINTRTYYSIQKVILPLMLISFILAIASFVIQIKIDIYKKEKEDASVRKTISSNERQEEHNVYELERSNLQRRGPFIDESGGIYISPQR